MFMVLQTNVLIFVVLHSIRSDGDATPDRVGIFDGGLLFPAKPIFQGIYSQSHTGFEVEFFE
jgi:hypothetical protein